MKNTITAAAALAAVLGASVAPAAAQDAPRVFTRTGQWQLEAGDEDCRIARVFTNGDDQVALALERNRADNVVRLVLVSNALTTYRTTEELGYRFLPDGEQHRARYITAEMDGGQTYYNLGNIPLGTFIPVAPGSPPFAPGTPNYDRTSELSYAATITGIEFNSGLTEPVRLETGSLRAAVNALQACTDDLLRTWGLDYQAHQTMTRRATPDGDPSGWIPEGTIGVSDFAAFTAGRNPFRVLVNAEGQPTACTAMWASLDATKNARVCNAIMENGRFLPALDANGNPMASYWMLNFMFGRPPSPAGR